MYNTWARFVNRGVDFRQFNYFKEFLFFNAREIDMMWILHDKEMIYIGIWVNQKVGGGGVQVLGVEIFGKFFLYYFLYIPLVTVVYSFASMLQIRLFLKFLPNRHNLTPNPPPPAPTLIVLEVHLWSWHSTYIWCVKCLKLLLLFLVMVLSYCQHLI